MVSIGINMGIEWFHILKLTIIRVVATHQPELSYLPTVSNHCCRQWVERAPAQ